MNNRESCGRWLPRRLTEARRAAVTSAVVLIVLILAAGVTVQTANADYGPGTTYSAYCSRKWKPSGSSTTKQYRAQLATSTGANETQFWVSWTLYVNINSAVSCSGYRGTVSGSYQADMSGTASTVFSSGVKTVAVVSGTYYYDRYTYDYQINVTGTISASSSGGSNPWNGEAVTTLQTITVPARNYYTITYNTDGGSYVAPTGNYYGYDAVAAGPPVKEGCVFEYWDHNGSRRYPGDSVNMQANYTFTAIWKSVNVTFNANRDRGGYNVSLADVHGPGLMISGDGTITRDGTPVRCGMPSSLVRPDDPAGICLVKSGYHIEPGREWNSRSDCTGDEYDSQTVYNTDTFADSTVVYANWQPNTYTVSFYPNGEGDVTGSMPDQTLTVDRSEHIQSNSFIRPGYRLAGWDTDPAADPSGALTVTGDRGSVMNLTRIQDDNIRLYAVWRPIEETDAEIYIGKIVKSNAYQDLYRFRIEAVEGWRHEHESAEYSGHAIPADGLPMPEGTPEGQSWCETEVTGLAGNPGVLRAGSAGLITFEDPGWYMYKVTEVIPDPPEEGITYDRTGYYVVVYVCYSEETGSKVKVYSTAAWHNSRGSGRNRPDLADIAERTDNGGESALENEEGVFGKTGAGANSILVRFWNDERPHGEPAPQLAGIRISKNVTGNLGDLTKKFHFTAALSGLTPNTSYSVINDGAKLADGFEGGALRSDAEGNASVSFYLRDDEGFTAESLPLGANISVTEDRSNHFPSYRVITDSGQVISEDSRRLHVTLSTGAISLTEAGELYSAEFTNSRDSAPVTGIFRDVVPLILLPLLTAGVLLAARAVRSADRRGDYD